jgi:hypothetical protein
MANPLSPDQARQIAEHQRRRFNELVDVFDTPQPSEVMARLQEIVPRGSSRTSPPARKRGVFVGTIACRRALGFNFFQYAERAGPLASHLEHGI